MSNLLQFFREAYEELRKVAWLSRAQMLASTWLVILLVIFFSIFVFTVDKIISLMFGYLV